MNIGDMSETLNNQNIVLVEDDIELASLVRDYLKRYGFSVELIDNGKEAVNYIVQNQPHLVILDVMLPGLSGMEVCKAIRSSYQGPILMLTALDEDMDQMLGLELGADDYIIKPVKPRLLLSRINAVLRRFPQNISVSNHADDSSLCVVDTLRREFKINDVVLDLTDAEYDLLLILYENKGDIISKEFIVKHLRGIEYDGLDRSIDRRLSRLRKKLADHAKDVFIIKTIRSKGYVLYVENDSEV